MIKIDWLYAALRIAKIYDCQFECEELFADEDNFFTCPECEEPILLEDYPELDGVADKSWCLCPICEEKLDLI